MSLSFDFDFVLFLDGFRRLSNFIGLLFLKDAVGSCFLAADFVAHE